MDLFITGDTHADFRRFGSNYFNVSMSHNTVHLGRKS